jgi:hypothetical protein
MSALPRSITAVFGTALLSLAAREPILADEVHTPIVSAGAVTTTTGSLLNAGQSGIGNAASRTHAMSAGGIPGIVHLSMRRLPGDIDGDGDVDLDDHAIFADCMNGPRVSVPPRDCRPEHFELADVQGDNDVDLGDFGVIAGAFTSGGGR